MPNTNIWEGHKVRLRSVNPDDLDVFAKDSEDTESARLNDQIYPPLQIDALKARLEKIREPDEPNIWLAVESRSDRRLVGSVNVHGADRRHRCFEYGIGIFRAERRKGYASEAITLLLRFYFQELGYHRALATVYAFNAGSIGLHQRLGLIQEGHLRQSIFSHGKFHDELLFSLLAPEFTELESNLPVLDFDG